jgi:hypothetical protein
MLNIKTWVWSLGSFGAVSFLICVVWGFLTPQPLRIERVLVAVLPGFKWLTLDKFILGLVESFLWGAYIGIVFVPIHNFFHRRHRTTAYDRFGGL